MASSADLSLSVTSNCDSDAFYHHAMHKIENQPEKQVQLAEQTLAWLTYAKRPLSTVELQHALAVQVGKPSFEQENTPPIDLILSVCAGLVVVDNDSGILGFASSAAQDYIEHKLTLVFPETAENLALTCLTYLCLEDFAKWPFVQKDTENGTKVRKQGAYRIHHLAFAEKLKDYPFIEYAATYWWQHACEAFTDRVRQLTLSWSRSDVKVSIAQVVEELASRPYEMALNDAMATAYHFPHLTAVHYAAIYGATALISTLLQDGMPADTTAFGSRTPLSIAAECGHISVVELLLGRNDVQAGSNDNQNRTPLSLAAEKGHLAVVKTLLQRDDVSPDAKDARGQTPLSYAAANGHTSVMKVLLARNDVAADSQDHWGQTPIFYGAEHGHGDAVSSLMAIPEVNVHDSFGKSGLTYEVTLLHFAARHGMDSLIQDLLDRGLLIDSRDHYGETPLMWSARGARPHTIELLLDRGASRDLLDERGRHALSHAFSARRGQDQIQTVRTLLDRGVAVQWDDVDKHINCSMFSPAEDHEVLRLLLDRCSRDLLKKNIPAALVQARESRRKVKSAGESGWNHSQIVARNRLIEVLESVI